MNLRKFAIAFATILSCYLGTAAHLCAAPADQAGNQTSSSYLFELVVQFDPDTLGASLPEVVDSISVDPNSAWAERFGHPSAAVLMMQLRYSDEGLSFLEKDDPTYALQNSVLLRFEDEESTASAVAILGRDKTVVAMSRNASAEFSTDPLIPPVSGPTGYAYYQWGLFALNVIQPTNFTGVWAKTRGSAYGVLLDNGIQTAPTVHADLAANYRHQFSYNYGYSNDGPTGGALAPTNLDESPAVGGFAGHGTHTAGLFAAANGNGLGGSGVCPSCSFASGRVTQVLTGVPSVSLAYVASGIVDQSLAGMQIISNSFGSPIEDCSTQPAICSALATAYARDVVFVAASGNNNLPNIDFPASAYLADGLGNYQKPGSIAVGGINPDGTFWGGSANQSSWGVTALSQQFVAPANTVISSVYTNFNWNTTISCGDSFPSGFMIGYGDCTGTSMATPQIAGLVGLIRSVDPLKSRLDIRNILNAVSSATACADVVKCNLGLPDATAAVNAALGGSNVLNRTSPLFGFYSSGALDHFYTYVPQMAMAAMTTGAMRPQPSGGGSVFWKVNGVALAQYPHFPTSACNQSGCSNTPKATALVYTTHVNPLGGADLVPLYRMSYRCGDELLTTPPNAARSICSTKPGHLSHVYATDEPTVRLLTGFYLNGVLDPSNPGTGFALDGIEGFIFSSSVAQPTGTIKLCRKYDPARDDYVMFPGAGVNGTDCTATSDGFTNGSYTVLPFGTDWIGWVVPATATYGPTPNNNLPTVSVTGPANNSTFPTGIPSITITATASDPGGAVASVRFFADEQYLGSSGSPYSVTWAAPHSSSGAYAITAVAIDNQGAITGSSVVNVFVGGSPTVLNFGFETPGLFPGDFSYATANPDWTFVGPFASGGSGISTNMSAMTNMNQVAPEGLQVGFIQGANTATQTINFPVAGPYHIQYHAAQRAFYNGHYLQLQLYIDGSAVGPVMQPVMSTYGTYDTAAFTISAGNHIVRFLGVNPFADDNTIFIDQMILKTP